MNSQNCNKKRALYFPLGRGVGGGGSIDVGLVGDNHHKLNLVMSNEGIVPLLWSTSYTPLLSK